MVNCNMPNGWMAKKQYDIKRDKVSNPDETISLEDDWEGSYDLPSGWMAKEKQHDIKKDKMSTPDENPRLENNCKDNSNLSSGCMAEI